MFSVITARGEANTRVWWRVNHSASPVMKLRSWRNYTRMELAIKRWVIYPPIRYS